MQEIDATYGTTTEPDHPQTGDGLNLSCRHRQATGPDDADGGPGGARDAALRLILAAGKDGTGASAMERELTQVRHHPPEHPRLASGMGQERGNRARRHRQQDPLRPPPARPGHLTPPPPVCRL